MSTTMYMRCESHDPPIQSDEVGHNQSALPDIRKAIRDRDEFLEGLEKAGLDLWDVDFGGDSYARARAWFVVQHPHCDISVWDEYGREYAMLDGCAEAPIGMDTVLGHIQKITEDQDGMTVTFYKLTPAGERVLRMAGDLQPISLRSNDEEDIRPQD